ncbi:MAG: M20 family metallopeptidase [Thermoanaerobaculales bacterium]|nr:M20 family metallopeptidase [Thermoanaerobaculales bacterium]
MDLNSPSDVLAAANEILPWMIEVRRDLHQNPELGLEEHRTSAKIQGLLDEMGIEHIDGLGVTGVLGLIRGTGEGKVVALRGDMDALPIQDAKDVSYASTIPGKMHACGHDVHTTVLLGAARLLQKNRSSFSGTVKLLFQPAEETVGGAKLLIAAGALENPRVDAIFGLHVDPELDVGRVGLHFGQRNASSDNLQIIVHGKAAHAAYPYLGVDAIVAAAHVVTSLQAIVSRNLDAREAAVVSLGTISGGTQANILADRVVLVGTVRCLDQATRTLVLQRIKETAEAVALALGARAEVNIEPSYDPVVNDASMVHIVEESSRKLLGDESVVIFKTPQMGVEDFGYYLSEVPGAFYSMGVRNEAAGIVHPVHNGLFDVDENAMAIGVALQVLNTKAVLAPC